MQNGAQLRYGRINPSDGENSSYQGYWASGEVVKAKSGRIVYINSDGRLALVTSSQALTFGFAETHEHTTVEDERCTVDISSDAIYRIPINSGTFVKSMIGKTCDVSIVSTIQGAALTGSARDIIIIVDGDLVNNLWVDVKLVNDRSLMGQGLGVV